MRNLIKGVFVNLDHSTDDSMILKIKKKGGESKKDVML